MYRLLIIVKVFIGQYCKIGVSKKTEKPIKPEKKITEKTEPKITRLNRLKFWKNQPVRFGFISKKPKKPNRTESKPEKNRAKTRKNQAKTEKTEPNQKTEPNRFEPVLALKNRTEPKPVSLTRFRFNFVFF